MSDQATTPWWVKLSGILIAVGTLAGGYFWWDGVRAERERERTVRHAAEALCSEWADRLDRQTTETGVYIRWNGDTLPDKDPWGRNLLVEYSQGGVSEVVVVRSLGPDGESNTRDDVRAPRFAMNFKGVGTGIKNNAEEVSERAGRGLARGVIDGAKEGMRGKPAENKQ
jgi:hypothetical protein